MGMDPEMLMVLTQWARRRVERGGTPTEGLTVEDLPWPSRGGSSKVAENRGQFALG